MSKTLENNKITADGHFQDTRHIVLDLDREDLTYEAGDIIMIQPKNDQQLVEEFIGKLGYDKEQVLRISVNQDQLGQVSQSNLLTFPEDGITILELLTYWINLMEPPSRYFMSVLSHFVDDQLHKEKLQEFCSQTVDGKSEYYRYSIREKRTVPEVLYDF